MKSNWQLINKTEEKKTKSNARLNSIRKEQKQERISETNSLLNSKLLQMSKSWKVTFGKVHCTQRIHNVDVNVGVKLFKVAPFPWPQTYQLDIVTSIFNFHNSFFLMFEQTIFCHTNNFKTNNFKTNNFKTNNFKTNNFKSNNFL